MKVERNKKLIEDVSNGKTLAEAGKPFGMGKRRVFRVVSGTAGYREMKLDLKNKRIADVIRLRAEGMHFSDIGKELGRSYDWARKIYNANK